MRQKEEEEEVDDSKVLRTLVGAGLTQMGHMIC